MEKRFSIFTSRSSIPDSNFMVGRGGFEPPKRKRNRFTVCPRWPLGYLPNFSIKSFKVIGQESNYSKADRKTRLIAALCTLSPDPCTLKKAGERNRTPDPRFTKPLLYQLSYASKTTSERHWQSSTVLKRHQYNRFPKSCKEFQRRFSGV